MSKPIGFQKKDKIEWKHFIEKHECVKEWLGNKPFNTQRSFARYLRNFCNESSISPEEWQTLDRFKARDLAWTYLKTLITEKPSVAALNMVALKSFYRNKDGELLPFDSKRGGKHYFHVPLQKAAKEHIPSKAEMYQIIDMATGLRNKGILFFLFCSGCRVNVTEHIRLKDVMESLDKDVFTLKITPELDNKLAGRDIPFYYTFVNGEGAEVLKRYIAQTHKRMNPNAFLFYTRSGKGISQSYVFRMFKLFVAKAGLNPETMWTHSIRKAFRKIVRQADIDDDDKEQLMGHVLKGSRQSYYDSKDIDVILAAYRKCNFMREVPKSEFEKLREQLTNERTQRALDQEAITRMQREIADLKRIVQSMIEKKA